MDINGIPLQSPVNKVITAASYISDPVKAFPVLDHCHASGDLTFHGTFIKNICLGKIIMRKGVGIVRGHDRNGTCVFKAAVNPFAC